MTQSVCASATAAAKMPTRAAATTAEGRMAPAPPGAAQRSERGRCERKVRDVRQRKVTEKGERLETGERLD